MALIREKKNSVDRRGFLKNTSLGGLAALGIPSVLSTAFKGTEESRVKLNAGDVILFQGDSITDWHRDWSDRYPNQANGLGNGYVLNAAAELLCHHPKDNLKIYNRGMNGNKVFQLADRWEADCLDLKPDILSILVGVNDFWHTLSIDYKGTAQTYKRDYTALLNRTKDALPDVQLIIGEPYALKGVKVVNDKWFPKFDGYREAAREIAKSFGAVFIPYQDIYNKAIKLAPAPYWSVDGVHPTPAGACLMSQALLQVMKG